MKKVLVLSFILSLINLVTTNAQSTRTAEPAEKKDKTESMRKAEENSNGAAYSGQGEGGEKDMVEKSKVKKGKGKAKGKGKGKGKGKNKKAKKVKSNQDGDDDQTPVEDGGVKPEKTPRNTKEAPKKGKKPADDQENQTPRQAPTKQKQG